jgi:hypothetical protein
LAPVTVVGQPRAAVQRDAARQLDRPDAGRRTDQPNRTILKK